jgi:hypothetical protein
VARYISKLPRINFGSIGGYYIDHPACNYLDSARLFVSYAKSFDRIRGQAKNENEHFDAEIRKEKALRQHQEANRARIEKEYLQSKEYKAAARGVGTMVTPKTFNKFINELPCTLVSIGFRYDNGKPTITYTVKVSGNPPKLMNGIRYKKNELTGAVYTFYAIEETFYKEMPAEIPVSVPIHTPSREEKKTSLNEKDSAYIDAIINKNWELARELHREKLAA